MVKPSTLNSSHIPQVQSYTSHRYLKVGLATRRIDYIVRGSVTLSIKTRMLRNLEGERSEINPVLKIKRTYHIEVQMDSHKRQQTSIYLLRHAQMK